MDNKKVFMASFIAAEGCFQFGLAHNERYTHNVNISPNISVAVHDDDKDILYQFQDQFNIGVINEDHTQNQTKWELRSKDDLSAFCDIFEEAVDICAWVELTDKYSTYFTWKSILEQLYSYRSNKTKQELEELIVKVKNLNSKGYQGKTAEEWIERIE